MALVEKRAIHFSRLSGCFYASKIMRWLNVGIKYSNDFNDFRKSFDWHQGVFSFDIEFARPRPILSECKDCGCL